MNWISQIMFCDTNLWTRGKTGPRRKGSWACSRNDRMTSAERPNWDLWPPAWGVHSCHRSWKRHGNISGAILYNDMYIIIYNDNIIYIYNYLSMNILYCIWHVVFECLWYCQIATLFETWKCWGCKSSQSELCSRGCCFLVAKLNGSMYFDAFRIISFLFCWCSVAQLVCLETLVLGCFSWQVANHCASVTATRFQGHEWHKQDFSNVR